MTFLRSNTEKGELEMRKLSTYTLRFLHLKECLGRLKFKNRHNEEYFQNWAYQIFHQGMAVVSLLSVNLDMSSSH